MDYKDLRTILIVSTYQDPKVIVGDFNIKNSDCENYYWSRLTIN